MNNNIFTIPSRLLIIDDVIKSQNKPTSCHYDLHSFISAMNIFNKKCPVVGGMLNRNHIERLDKPTHITHRLFINEYNIIVADISFIDKSLEEKTSGMTIKPIIAIPLILGKQPINNAPKTTILKIVRVQIEL